MQYSQITHAGWMRVEADIPCTTWAAEDLGEQITAACLAAPDFAFHYLNLYGVSGSAWETVEQVAAGLFGDPSSGVRVTYWVPAGWTVDEASAAFWRALDAGGVEASDARATFAAIVNDLLVPAGEDLAGAVRTGADTANKTIQAAPSLVPWLAVGAVAVAVIFILK